jgi:hypothetical protein
MSSFISSATGALAAFECSPSLVRANFDFTLLKFEAPPEYHGVGTTISERRKIRAENGSVHRTARRLGALFESILPSTPELYRAYGTRVSEIAQSTKVNPRPTARDGIFAGEVGVDTTSLWAAVTSGDGGIGVHLLACLLARMWRAPQAISIWEEFVTERKAEIRRQTEAATYPSKHTPEILAAMQDISREELATWDASARSWIQSADQVKLRQHKQLMLILENVGIAISSQCNLYSSVISAWTSALQAMNDLIKGTALQIQDGSALLAMSSWHLYPDMIVLGGVAQKVPQNDKLFQTSATLTVGLQFADKSRHSVSWSLSLAHLKYYGHPVQSNGSIGLENSRVTIDQFAFIVLGCVLGRWKEYASTAEIGLSWIIKIADLLEKFPKRLEDTPENSLSLPNKSITTSMDPFLVEFYNISKHTSWIGWLFHAAHRLLDSTGIERELGMRQLALGRRRCEALCSRDQSPAPVFGLANPSILIPIITNEDSRIEFLRDLAKKLNLSNSTHIIRYKRTSELGVCPFEYASVRQIEMPPTQLISSGSAQPSSEKQPSCARWLPISAYFLPNIGVLRCMCNPRCVEYCPCRLRNTECSVLCHDETISSGSCGNSNFMRHMRMRSNRITESGEHCFPLLEMAPYQNSIASKDMLLKIIVSQSFGSGLDAIACQNPTSPLKDLVGLKLVAGDNPTAAIFALDYGRNVLHPGQSASLVSDIECGDLQPETLEKALVPNMLDLDRLVQWFTWFKRPIMRHREMEESSSNEGAEAEADGYKIFTTSLRACVAASEIYKLLPDSTISTAIVEQSLWKSKWLPTQPKGVSHLISKCELSRRQVFACIAMLDSGTCNLDPDGLREAFAMSTGNSIFVVQSFLCDPHEIPRQTEIKRVIGNVGRPGITFLVPPAEPQTRCINSESWALINHLPFDGKLEDCFQKTTIHLGFTAYEMPLSDGLQGHHIIDRPAALVETLISVHDRGKWVADLDVLMALEQDRGGESNLQISHCSCREAKEGSCKRKYSCTFEEVFGDSRVPLISLDNWEEFLDAPPDRVLVVRAHQNWLARLAFTVMSVSRGRRTLVLPADVCWYCCKNSLENTQRRDASSSILIC